MNGNGEPGGSDHDRPGEPASAAAEHAGIDLRPVGGEEAAGGPELQGAERELTLRDVCELLRRYGERIERIRAEDADSLKADLKKLSRLAGDLGKQGEADRKLYVKWMEEEVPRDRQAWTALAERVENAVMAQSEDFGRWNAREKRLRRRLPLAALAVAVPALLLLGILIELQFQVIPPHDPSGGWGGWIWENHGRTIVDCAVEARRLDAVIECSFPVRKP